MKGSPVRVRASALRDLQGLRQDAPSGWGSSRVQELLARTVLYKVGHHGSHNATLAGTADDAEHPNLAWMGQGSAASEFTAMITAVTKWAMEKNDPPWVHPLPSIREALNSKAQGRVFQTDENEPVKPDGVSDGEWKKFTDRSVFEALYFDWMVLDE